jgi:hemerythrin-like metal-binding protein
MMPKLRWDPCLETGIEEIDWEHRRLLSIANRLLDAMSKGKGEAVVQPVVKDLASHAAAHFTEEEKFMRDMGFPDVEAHAAEHRQMAADLETYVTALESASPPGAKELSAIMSHWLLDHVLKKDKEYARFSQKRAGKESC